MWKKLIAGVGVFATSLGTTYITLKTVNNNGSSSSTSNSLSSWTSKSPEKETAGERLLGSLLSYEAMDIKGDVRITLENRDQITLAIDGQGTIADIENIQLLADMDLSIGGIRTSGQFGYFKDTMTFSVDEICNFKLKTDDLLDFMEMIPTYGVSIELPDSLKNLDTNTLLSKITSLEDEDVRTVPTGERFYTITLGENEDAFDIDVLADTNNNIKGIKIDRLEYQNTEISLRINIDEISGDKLNIVNPLEGEDAAKYQDFKPFFTLFDNFYSLLNQNQFGVKISADLAKNDKKIVDAELDLNIDKETNAVGVDVSLYGDSKEDGSKDKYTLNAAYLDGTIYAKYHNVAVSIETLSISNLISYVMEEVGDQFSNKITSAIEGFDMNSIDLGGITSKIKNTLKKINMNEGSFEVILNLNDFNEYIESETPVLPEDNIALRVNFDDHKITSITISTLNIASYTINLKVEFTDYKPVVIVDPDSYVKLEASDILVESVVEFVKQKAYYIGFDIDTDDHDNTTTDLSMNGYVQLDFTGDNHYGYGSATIIDSNNYRHNLKADMYNEGNFIFSYNDKLKGKFTSETVFELADLVSDIINNPDDHFNELFGELLEKLNSSTIKKIIGGDYTLALQYELISNLAINDAKTSFDLSLAIFGMEDTTLHIEIGYSYDAINYSYADLDYIKVSNLTFAGKDIEINLDFKKYQTSLDATRLNQFDTYLDFSCIKTLLALGVNTSKFNYYHFSGNLNLNISLIGDGSDLANIGLDCKIRNDHGNVTVAIALTNIPIIKWGFGLIDLNSVPGYESTDSRNAYIYYQHFEDSEKTDYWYINRQDVVTEKGDKVSGFIFNRKYQYTEYDYQVVRKCTNEYFLDNIVDILVKDILGVTNSTVLNALDSSSTSSTSEIKYEEILSDFYYTESKNAFYFDINMKALTGTSIFDMFEVTVYEDPTNNILKGLSAKIRVNFGIKITATFDLNFENDRSIDIFTRDDEGNLTTTPLAGTVITSASNYIAAHKNDTADIASSVVRNVIRTYVA